MENKELIALLRRGAAALETPGDLTPEDIEEVAEDLASAAETLDTTYRAPIAVALNKSGSLVGYLDHYGRLWPYPKNELCAVCGQPDSCGVCNHQPIGRRGAEQILLGIEDPRVRMEEEGDGKD